MSNQSLGICVAYLNTISERIAAFLNPPSSKMPVMQKPIPVESLPRISAPLRHENILSKPAAPSTTSEKFESTVGAVAKSYGQSPNPGTIRVPSASSSPAQSLSGYLPAPSPRKLLTLGSRSSTSPQDQSVSRAARDTINIYTMKFLRSSFGIPFRQTFARRARAVVLGSPSSTLQPLISSIHCLSSIAKASLTEDPYGKTAQNIPLLLRTFVNTIQSIDIFMSKGLRPQWTDVEFREGEIGEGRRVPEIDILVRELKAGLKDVVVGFGSFVGELGMKPEEMTVAKKLIAGHEKQSNGNADTGIEKPEMAQVK